MIEAQSIHETKKGRGCRESISSQETLTHNNRGAPEVFLLFDLEFAYGAALHLIMANAVFPGADEHDYAQLTLALLDEMINRGNKVAEVRKAELEHLQTLCRELAMQSERHGLEPLTLAVPEGLEMQSDTAGAEEAQQEISVAAPGAVAVMPEGAPTPSTSMDHINMGNNSESFMDNLGISSYEIFTLADQLENQDILTTMCQ